MPRSRNRGGYGSFRYTEGRGGRVIIDRDWMRENAGVCRIPKPLRIGGSSKTVKQFACHKAVAPYMELVFRAWESEGVYPQTFDGCWVARHMLWNPRKPLSNHSWGTAVDLDASRNPYITNSRLRRHRQPTESATVRARIAAHYGFVWLGLDRRGIYYDPMHYEAAPLKDMPKGLIVCPFRPSIRLIVGKRVDLGDATDEAGYVGDGYAWKEIASEVVDGKSMVNPAELLEWLDITCPVERDSTAWFKSLLDGFKLRYTVSRAHINDRRDPRVYVKVEI